MMSTEPVNSATCNDLRSSAGSRYGLVGSQSAFRDSPEKKLANGNGDDGHNSCGRVRRPKTGPEAINDMVSHFIPVSALHQTSAADNATGTNSSARSTEQPSRCGAASVVANTADPDFNNSSNSNKSNNSSNSIIKSSGNPSGGGIGGISGNVKILGGNSTAANHPLLLSSSDSNGSSPTRPTNNNSNGGGSMICSAEEVQDPQQAQPLLVDVKTINDWPNRNGSIGGAGNATANIGGVPNAAILFPSPNYKRGDRVSGNVSPNNDKNDDTASCAAKLDIYSLNGGPIAIDVPSSPDLSDDFPPEKFKTFVALVILLCSFFFTTISLAIVHDRVPDRKVYKPLPDTFLDLVAPRDWALSVSEIFIMITTNITLFIVVLHRHRYIVFRRMFLILSLLYFMRSITMFVTVLPVSSESYSCSDKDPHPTVGVILVRALQLCSGLGLTINGKHTYCGDYIYSGHTTILVMGYLTICEYSPRRYYLLHWSAWLMALIGVLMVLVSHGHYTVDVIVAYFITTRLFWLYHTLANNAFLKERSSTNYLAREWWFVFFQYFEGNVKGPVPLEYNCPFRWSNRFFWSGSYRCNNS